MGPQELRRRAAARRRYYEASIVLDPDSPDERLRRLADKDESDAADLEAKAAERLQARPRPPVAPKVSPTRQRELTL